MPPSLPVSTTRPHLRVTPTNTEIAGEGMIREPLVAKSKAPEVAAPETPADPAPPNAAARMAVRAGVPSQTLVSAPESILVIDDSAADSQRMIDLLTGLYPRNLKLYHRASGQAALELIRRANIDVIFVGYRLTDMDGVEFISEASDCLEDTAMILLGGAWDGPCTANAMKSGARDFLDKSRMDAFLIREVIETALRSVRIDYRLNRTAASLRTQTEIRGKQLEAISLNVKTTLASLEDSLRELRTSARNLTVWELDEQIELLENDLRASRDMVGQLGRRKG